MYVLTPSKNDQLVARFEPPFGPMLVNGMLAGNGALVVKLPVTRIEVVYKPAALELSGPVNVYVVAKAKFARHNSEAPTSRRKFFKLFPFQKMPAVRKVLVFKSRS